MDLTELLNAYADKFGGGPPIFGYGLDDNKLSALLAASRKSGKAITRAQLKKASGRSAPKAPLSDRSPPDRSPRVLDPQ